MVIFRQNNGTIPAKQWYYSGTTPVLFRHDTGTIPVRHRHYSSTTPALLRHDTGTTPARHRHYFGTHSRFSRHKNTHVAGTILPTVVTLPAQTHTHTIMTVQSSYRYVIAIRYRIPETGTNVSRYPQIVRHRRVFNSLLITK